MIYVSSWFLLAAIGLSVFGPPAAFALGWYLRGVTRSARLKENAQ